MVLSKSETSSNKPKARAKPKKKAKPRPPSIRDFEDAIKYSEFDRTKAIAFLVTCREMLTQDDFAVLRDLLPMEKSNVSLDIDLKEMMQEQMMCARALRNAHYNLDGSLRPTVDAKDARESLRAAQQIMDSILKKQEKIDLSSKLMIMEQSLLAIAQELPDELQAKFYQRVERILGEQNHG